jgi:hypothetical protein
MIVILATEQIDDSYFTRLSKNLYASIVDSDLTRNHVAKRIICDELRDHLDRHFPGWKLLRKVNETVRPGKSIRRFKTVTYVLEIGSAKDEAASIQSRLVNRPV